MLTDKEKLWILARDAWLDKVDPWGNRIFCHSCKTCNLYKENEVGQPYCEGLEEAWVYEGNFDCWLIPSRELLLEAAEFSERVVAKLAITGNAWDFEDMPCRGEQQYMRSKCPLRKNHWDCADCYIKAARLQIEEEMNGETSI